jgi:hypothetical protein
MEVLLYSCPGTTVQLWGRPRGVCLSTTTTYSLIVIQGRCVEWVDERTSTLTYRATFDLDNEDAYTIVRKLSCWALLALLEMDYVHTHDLLELCYGPDD